MRKEQAYTQVPARQSGTIAGGLLGSLFTGGLAVWLLVILVRTPGALSFLAVLFAPCMLMGFTAYRFCGFGPVGRKVAAAGAGYAGLLLGWGLVLRLMVPQGEPGPDLAGILLALGAALLIFIVRALHADRPKERKAGGDAAWPDHPDKN